MTHKELAAYNDWSAENPTEAEWVAREERAAHEPSRAELIGDFGAARLTQDMLSRFTAAELHEHAAILRADLAAVHRQLSGRAPRSAPPQHYAVCANSDNKTNGTSQNATHIKKSTRTRKEAHTTAT